jgi:hypothetical protein
LDGSGCESGGEMNMRERWAAVEEWRGEEIEEGLEVLVDW